MNSRSFERAATIRTMTRSGTSTTEYEAAQSGGWWGIIATVLGIIITMGSVAADALGSNSSWGILAGAAVALAGIAQKALVSLGYIKARADVKIAAAQAVAAEAQADAVAEASSAPAAPTAGEVDPIAGMTRL